MYGQVCPRGCVDGLDNFESDVGQTLPKAFFFVKVDQKSPHSMKLEEINLRYGIPL